MGPFLIKNMRIDVISDSDLNFKLFYMYDLLNSGINIHVFVSDCKIHSRCPLFDI